MMPEQNRRTALKHIVMSGIAAGAGGLSSFAAPKTAEGAMEALKGNINHAVCRWCYSGLSVEELCIVAKNIGIRGIDLVGPADWPTLKTHGLTSSMCNGAEINLVDGFNTVANHAKLVDNYSKMIPLVAEAGYTNLICFSGNRRGMDDETGLRNCVDGLRQILPLAEKSGVMIVMELLNSKINHKDYMCDRTAWGVELCKRLGSPNFKLLYDIYHMQIDEGDVIRTIKENHPYIAHYHTGGVPGRNEIDETQELYYPAIMKAIVETGYKGFVAQEFVPARADKVGSLRQSVLICDV
jgi:hydroxypyruvate isomerase